VQFDFTMMQFPVYLKAEWIEKVAIFTTVPITVAARSKAWAVFASSNSGIVGSNPTRGMDVCVCVVLCGGSGLDHGVLLTGYRLRNFQKRPWFTRTVKPLIYTVQLQVSNTVPHSCGCLVFRRCTQVSSCVQILFHLPIQGKWATIFYCRIYKYASVCSETWRHCGKLYELIRTLSLVTESVTEIMQVWTMNVYWKEQQEREKAESMQLFGCGHIGRIYVYTYNRIASGPLTYWKGKTFLTQNINMISE
jgi:hypothetical protein